MHYNNIEGEAIGILHGLEKFHHCCFTHKVQCDNRPQTTGGNFQERHSKPITQTTKNITMHSSIQHKNPYKSGSQVLIANWLSRQSHKINRD